jgi:hypothetical protein
MDQPTEAMLYRLVFRQPFEFQTGFQKVNAIQMLL